MEYFGGHGGGGHGGGGHGGFHGGGRLRNGFGNFGGGGYGGTYQDWPYGYPYNLDYPYTYAYNPVGIIVNQEAICPPSMPYKVGRDTTGNGEINEYQCVSRL